MEVWIESLIQNQVMSSLIEILISGIIIMLAIIYVNVIFKKSSPKDLDAEREFKEDWKGTIEDFIEYKKFQYDRGFGLLKEITPYIIFFLTLLLIASKDVIISLVGQSIYYSLFMSEIENRVIYDAVVYLLQFLSILKTSACHKPHTLVCGGTLFF
mgnify:CR=1 FL=1